MTSLRRIIIYTLIPIISNVASDQIITTNSGQVKGVTVSKTEPTIEAFLGIPYAEPPIGELRFRRPVSKKPWSDVYSAVNLPPTCMQGNTGAYFEQSLDTPMSEDCLFLNLWVPYSQDKNPKTIMLYIHGGALIIGTASMKLYDGTNLARKGDVIVASMNYRLGTFGFLFADIEEANGSMGMFDQIMALKWIKDNARAFGGDPDNIVLFGESAGSLSIGYHLLSPLSKHLFRRAIMQSGSPAHQETLSNSLLIRSSQKVAYLSGCAADKTGLKDNPKEVVSCMRGLPAQNITDTEVVLRETIRFPYTPRMNDDFVPHDPSYLLTHGHFNNGTEVLIGHNEAEGPFFLAAGAPEYFKDGEITVTSKRLAYNFLRMVLRMIGTVKGEKELAKSYMNTAVNGSYLDAIGHAIGDYYIVCCAYFYAELESLKNPVYYYVMKYRPPTSPLGEWAKMTHFDEIQYVFGNPLFGNFTAEERAFSDKVMERWLAFAKTGNPNIPGEVEWPRFRHDDHKYMVLSEKDSVHSDRPDADRCEFWREKAKTVIDEEVLSRFKRKTLKNEMHR